MPPRKILHISTFFFLFAVVLLAILLFIKPENTPKGQANVFENIPKVMMTVEPTASALPVTTAVPAPTNQGTPQVQTTSTPVTIPDSFYITHITGHRQVYHLGCEASASVDWANYFGVSIIEYTFQVSLPHSPDNPDYGFVGDVNSVWGQIPPYAYGVYSGPVADLLQKYGLPAKSVKNYTLDQVKQELSQSRPIIVWVIGKMEWSKPVEYVDSEGRSVLVAPYEHVVILTGYDSKADTIRFISNGVFYDVPTQTFLTSWGVLGNMAVIYDKSASQ